MIKYMILYSNQSILVSGLGLGLQINLQICGFYKGLALIQGEEGIENEGRALKSVEESGKEGGHSLRELMLVRVE